MPAFVIKKSFTNPAENDIIFVRSVYLKIINVASKTTFLRSATQFAPRC